MRGQLTLGLTLIAALALGCAGNRKATTQSALSKQEKQRVAAVKEAEKRQAKARAAEAKAEKKRLAEARQREEAQAKREADARKREAEARKREEAQEKREAELAARKEREQRAVALANEKAQAKRLAKEQREQAKRDEKAAREQEKLAAQARRDADREQKKLENDRKWEIGHEMMMHEDEPRLFDAFAKSAAAAGAAQDAGFSDVHFDGNQLNSLGRAKLALILENADNGPVTVYVAGGERVLAGRMAAIEKYWKDSPYAQVQLQSREGHNLAHASPADAGIRGLAKLEQQRRTNGSGSGTSRSNSSMSETQP